MDINTTNDTKSNTNPITLIDKAISSGIDVEKLEKLLELQERWEAKEAKKAFYDALAKFQSQIPDINKSTLVDFTGKTGIRTHYKYASLPDIDKAIKKPLADNGLTRTFHIEEENGKIIVTCKISHNLGHSETTTMSAIPDNSGNKNAIQANGSTVTYLQRYTLVGALGLTTVEDDDDGQTARVKPQINAPKSHSNKVEDAKVVEPTISIYEVLEAIQNAQDAKMLKSVYEKYITFKDNEEIKAALALQKKFFIDEEKKKVGQSDNTQVVEATLIPFSKYVDEETRKIIEEKMLKAASTKDLQKVYDEYEKEFKDKDLYEKYGKFYELFEQQEKGAKK